MKIMKTNMLLLDNKMIREDAGNTTTVDAPVPSPVEPKEGMKALSFLGMQNLMANPKLAKEIGVMNGKSAEEPKADSYVAPYSSNMAFKGGVKNVAKAVAMSAAVLMGAASLTSCDDVDVSLKAIQENYFDVTAILEAINRLEANQAQRDAEQAKRDQEKIDALNSVITLLLALNSKADLQNMSIEELKEQIYGQNEAILNAIVVLQDITKEEAKKQVDAILEAYAKGMIDFKTAMAEIQALLKTNNELLGEILSTLKDIKAAAEKANEHKDSLLTLANTVIANQNKIIKNQKYANEQRNAMSAQLDSLIKQNNIQINNDKKIIKAIKSTSAAQRATIREVAGDLGVKVDSLISIVSKLNIPVDDETTKAELIALLEQHLAELQLINGKLDNINTADLLAAAKDIQDILTKISGDLAALLAKVDSILTEVNKFAPLMQTYGDSILAKANSSEKILKEIKANSDTIKYSNQDIKAILEGVKPQIDSLYALAKERNVYLDIISKYQPKISAAVDSINVKAGKGLTKDELEALWQVHDANAWTQFSTYMDGIHADDLAKADKIIGYQKEGNKTALDIYNLLLKKLDKLDKLDPEELKALLEAIYKYLPELKCQCNCQGDCNNNTVNEGIINNILN